MATGSEEAKLELFLQWLKVNGAELRGCKLKYCNSNKGFGIFSTNDVPDDSGILLVVPLDLAITPMRVLQDPLIGPDCRSMFEEGEVDDRLLVMLFLTVERLRKSSSWKPYLDMLPTEFGNPLWFTDDEFSELKGTTLHRATELQKKNLKSLFDGKVKKLVEKLLALDGNSDREVRFEDFLWANSIFWTRALNIPFPTSYVFPSAEQEQDNTTSTLPGESTNHVSTEKIVNTENGSTLQINNSVRQVSGVESTLQERETIWVEGLVPGIDFCNHDLKAAATWEVDGTGSTTGIPFSMYLLSAGNILLQGEKEISISYGNKGNEELLYLYGFVIKDNPDDYLMIHYPMEAISDVPFSETKMQLLEAQKGELRCLLPRSLLKSGFFPESTLPVEPSNKDSGSQGFNYSWSGQRKAPSYIDKLVFPEEFLTALRTITMKENELYQVSSLLEEDDENGEEGSGTEESDAEFTQSRPHQRNSSETHERIQKQIWQPTTLNISRTCPEQEVSPAQESGPSSTEVTSQEPVPEQEVSPAQESGPSSIEVTSQEPVPEQEVSPAQESGPSSTEVVTEQDDRSDSHLMILTDPAGVNGKEQFRIMGLIGKASDGGLQVYRAAYIAERCETYGSMSLCDVFVAVIYVSMDAGIEVIMSLRARLEKNGRIRNHPNVMGIRNAFFYEGNMCLVFPFMDLGSMRSIMATRFPDGLPEVCILLALREALKGLSFIHANDYVHKEINAGHIFFNGKPEIKLAFSASVFELDEDQRQSSSSSSSSSSFLPAASICEWAAAPEVQESINIDAYTQEADIWAIGITALELGYGGLRVINREALENMVTKMHLKKKLPKKIKKEGDRKLDKLVCLDPTAVPFMKSRFSKGFENLVMKCLNLDPTQRPTADELLQDEMFTKLDVSVAFFAALVRE
ncbi:Serine/threonine-protein kinase dst1 [Sesamum alatum]|uniref:Serine/threonine-protein kinase dst1 n=1 Tax=Sesamum alatum TaxID=300844 RepID=A0AAE1XWA4_9LAMI|nr:Serine/threonine-protein kinase dst1 [Sesamum alatum]